MTLRYSNGKFQNFGILKVSLINSIFFFYILLLALYTLLSQEIALRHFFGPAVFLTSIAIVILNFISCFNKSNGVNFLAISFTLMFFYHIVTSFFLVISHPDAIYRAIIYGSSPFLIFLSAWAFFNIKELNFSNVAFIITLIFTPLIVYMFIMTGRFDIINIESSRVSNISNIASSFLLLSLAAKKGVLLRILQIVLILVIFSGMKRSGLLFIFSLLIIYLLTSGFSSFVYRLMFLVSLLSAWLFFNLDKTLIFVDMIILRFNEMADGGSGRIDIWLIIFEYLKDQNLFFTLFGNGYGVVSRSIVPDFAASHNDFLDFVMSYGLIGLVFLAFIFCRLLLLVTKLHRNKFLSAGMTLFAFFAIYSSVAGVFYFYMFFSFFFVWMAYLEFQYSIYHSSSRKFVIIPQAKI